MISEEMPELVELFDKKQLDSLVNSLIVNDHTRRMSLKEILAVLKEARDSQLEDAVETLKAELMKPESFGQILEQVSPVKGRDYFTEEEKESFVKKVASKIRTPRAGVDYFTESEKTTLSNYLHSRIYKEVLDELLLRKEYSISSVDIEGLVRKVAGAIKIPEYQPESADKIAKKLSTLSEAIPVKAIKGAVTMDDVLKALKDPKGKHKLSAGDILNMPARGPLDQRWHGAGISEVTHDATLTGTGTPDSPLSVVGGGGAVDSVNGQTGVVVLDTGDIAESTNANYVSDAESTLLGGITASAAEINILDGATLTTTELNYVDGVTSAIQTQLDNKQGTISFGTGVQTALGVNIGSAGAPVLFNGALGTPSSGTVTNLTGTASININGTVGATTPTTATFTTATINTSLLPDANDGAVIGAAGTAFSDIFLAEGGVINWDSSDVTLTQTGNILAVAGGDLRVATADVGTNADSVPTLSSTSTFTNKTLTSPTINTATIGGATPLAENASIDLDPSLSADGTYSGIAITGTAGTTLAFGDLIYLAVADSRWELADADAATTSDRMLGICVLAAASDGSATKILLHGNIRADAAFPTLTVGAPVYVGETAGDVQTAIPTGADNVIRRVGYALTADSLYFCPSMDSQITVA